MKKILFSGDFVTLILSNHNKNADNVYKRLKSIGCFDETVFVESKGVLQNRSSWKKIIEIFQLSFCMNNDYSFYLRDLKDLRYDEYISYNLEIDNYGIYSILSEYNANLKYSSYEEGVLSYESFYYDSAKFKVIRGLRKLVGKSNIFDKYDTFYCMYPQLYDGNLKTVIIPPIKTGNTEIRSTLAQIFDLSNDIDYSTIRCIFFESIYETEGRPIGEMEILLDIIEEIGKDSILIKKHPRSNVDTFERIGVKIDSNSSVPFEVIQLVNDLSGCVLVSATSGSVFSVNALIEKPSKAVLFYPLTSYTDDEQLKAFVPHIDNVISKLKLTGKFDYLRVVHSKEELVSEIKE